MTKSTWWSSRGPEFYFYHTHYIQFTTPVLGYSVPISGFCRHQERIWYTDIHIEKIHIKEGKNDLKKNFSFICIKGNT